VRLQPDAPLRVKPLWFNVGGNFRLKQLVGVLHHAR
jgi:hypothetical protein